MSTNLTTTGRTTTHYGHAAPEYTGKTYTGEDHHERAILPDGTVVLVADFGGVDALWTHAVVVEREVDDSVQWARRPASESLAGIIGDLPYAQHVRDRLRCSHDDLVGFLRH